MPTKANNTEDGFTFIEALVTIALAGIATGALLFAVYQLSGGSQHIINRLIDSRKIAIVDTVFRRAVQQVRPPYWAIDTIVEERDNHVVCRYYVDRASTKDDQNDEAEFLDVSIAISLDAALLILQSRDSSKSVRLPGGNHLLSIVRDSEGVARGLEISIGNDAGSVRIIELFGAQAVVSIYPRAG